MSSVNIGYIPHGLKTIPGYACACGIVYFTFKYDSYFLKTCCKYMKTRSLKKKKKNNYLFVICISVDCINSTLARQCGAKL